MRVYPRERMVYSSALPPQKSEPPMQCASGARRSGARCARGLVLSHLTRGDLRPAPFLGPPASSQTALPARMPAVPESCTSNPCRRPEAWPGPSPSRAGR